MKVASIVFVAFLVFFILLGIVTSFSVVELSLTMFMAGFFGGFVGILLSGAGFRPPSTPHGIDGQERPFFFGWWKEVLLGSSAAMIYAWIDLYPDIAIHVATSSTSIALTLEQLGYATLIGIGGGGWLTQRASIAKTQKSLAGKEGELKQEKAIAEATKNKLDETHQQLELIQKDKSFLIEKQPHERAEALKAAKNGEIEATMKALSI